MTNESTEVASKEIVISRTFDTPRQDLWQAWTQPDQIEQWWGPRGFTTRVDEMKFERGGNFKYTMLDADANEYPSVGVFQEITEPQRIVATDEFGDSANNDQAAPEGLPTGMITTTAFDEENGKTTVTISIMHQSVADRKKHEGMGVVTGFNEQLDKLEEYLG
ncbi:SRPBCC domain-containing protein [Fodinibius salsisoli]|uniref:SRPBCC domain-containing protein n=1 Tax=Fodinibius salsisoli TaxID=2820877 RepID=A0ABT3PHX2_9BACT|nr:SRPBCC domain-containing protein [Fodinibius salsisoli]MCW9705531.1 SRPBCC domain-containing protein [Fodinibius salsisoli]